jgi:SAM-dependent methyltransferase
MRNPWLDIPAADYLGHMGSPDVDQLSALGRLFGETLAHARPADVLLLGCATGNGLDRIDASVTRLVTGVDINPEYLDCLRAAWPAPPFELRLECADLMSRRFDAKAFDLVHAALLFEYLDWPQLVPGIAQTLRPGGWLSVVLQAPSGALPAVTRTSYPSLLRLEPVFQFVDPAAVVARGEEVGLELQDRRTDRLPSGKAFELLRFRQPGRR